MNLIDRLKDEEMYVDAVDEAIEYIQHLEALIQKKDEALRDTLLIIGRAIDTDWGEAERRVEQALALTDLDK